MKKFLSILLVALSLTMFSCGDSSDITSTQSFTCSMINRVNGVSSYSAFAGSYTYAMDFVAKKVTITASKVKFNANMPEVTFVIKDIPLTVNAKGYIISGSNIVPEVDGTPMSNYIINSISARIYPTAISNGVTYGNVAQLQYKVNDTFTINAIPDPMLFLYQSQTTVTGGSKPFTSSNAQCGVVMDVTADTASITIKGAQFASQMPAMNMRFNGINLKATANGFVLNKDSLVPVLIGDNGSTTPAPNYIISDLSATILNDNIVLNFKCSLATSSSAMATYTVQLSSSIFPATSSN